ncbi:conserved hypothetical protein [Histoplasma capsulatum G186AR]|uniref:CBF1-interacting co-repressor CIR N-terminal domain-containing protein n=2 Tax=Ajellomyces capsulatus TaxID=5037 RepID=C0NL88_AJECG|nr:uncharacterized protein HCBG_03918 [Histoplasma capsulatum G186AR]EEH08629.1 conserved hypothetical protein [Histoplasma capsulatum G186AR]KAG5299050.1 hypothetical protein I7I52_09228 [Histoplasma capsulatum]QSS68330.1 hypothetical protein I7I50_07700 [Histoplasma capsulatum G186AR]
MVLHLLGKKSWNVYNRDNIARVRRDEAEAKAREEEERRHLQQVDAEKRLEILRGLRSPSKSSPPPDPEESPANKRRDQERERGPPHRKRRRIAGENDTDRDIRFAREDAQRAEARREKDVVVVGKLPKDDAPLMDDSGHISLFPEPAAADSVINDLRKNPEAEAEATRKKREYEDQYTMRFSNAAGFKTSLDKGPWYSSSTTDIAAQTVEDMLPNKDVWGNEDPRRQERERARISMGDPLMAMKRGVRQLRDVERERNKWAEEKKRELKVFKEEERRERRDSSRHRREMRRRRGSNASHNSLDGFSLDAGTQPLENSRGRNRERSKKHRREGRERNQERSSKHMRSYVDSQSHKTSRNHETNRSKCPSADK